MRNGVFGTMAFVALLAGCKSETQKDQDILQGTWTVTSVNENGSVAVAPKGSDKQLTIAFSGNTVTIQFGGAVAPDEKSFQLDASQNPKQIDMFTTKKGKDGRPMEIVEKGIYLLNYDKSLDQYGLTICAAADGTRPVAFSGGKRKTIMELKRKK